MRWSSLQALDETLKLIWSRSEKEASLEIASLASADEPLSQSLVFIKSKKYLQRYMTQRKSRSLTPSPGVVLDEKVFLQISEADKEELISISEFMGSTASVDKAMILFSKAFYEEKYDFDKLPETVIHESVVIEEGAYVASRGIVIGKDSVIMSGARLMNACHVGERTLIFPNVTIYPFVKIGNDCRIHAQSVLGADGFGYQFSMGVHHKIWHMGGVIVEDQVEIGASSSIDSGTFSPTIIGAGTKIDNQVQVGHNCRLGKGVILCGHVGLAGSVKVGNYCVFGGFAGSAPDVTLGDACQVAGGTLINHDWPAGSKLGGYPAKPLTEWMRSVAWLSKQVQRKQKSDSDKDKDE